MAYDYTLQSKIDSGQYTQNNPQTPAVRSTGSMSFPEGLSNYPYWFSFSFYQYKMPFAGGITTGTFTDQGTIRLPMPNRMEDHQDIRFDQEQLGTALGAVVSSLQQTGGPFSLTGLASGAAAAASGTAVQAAAAGQTGRAFLQSQGVAANPFLTVMFKSPAFKKHVFRWKLSPSNERETAILGNIVKTFKFNQLPAYSGAAGGTLLTWPNIVQITVSAANPNTFYYQFKPCVVESFSVNFAPSGQPSFFGSTQAPTEVEISLGLLEIEYWLQQDIGTPNTTGVGSTLQNILNTGPNIMQKVLEAVKIPPPPPGTGQR